MTEIKDPDGLLAAYNKAKEDLVELRGAIKTLEAEKQELQKSAESLSDYKTKAIRAEIRADLEGQGIKNAERIIKYLDLDGVDYDKDGKLAGADEKLKVIKTDFPELFDAKTRASRVSADIHADNPSKVEMSDTELQVARLFGDK